MCAPMFVTIATRIDCRVSSRFYGLLPRFVLALLRTPVRYWSGKVDGIPRRIFSRRIRIPRSPTLNVLGREFLFDRVLLPLALCLRTWSYKRV